MTKSIKEQLTIILFTSMISSVFTSAGWAGVQYYNESKLQEKFTNELYQKLYDKSAAALENLDNKYSNLMDYYDRKYGLSTYEYKDEFEEFTNAVEGYKSYVKELGRYGNSSQVEVANPLQELVSAIYADFYLHYSAAEQVESRVQSVPPKTLTASILNF